ncbi:unnamed protein product [Ixodes pacificus]
MEFDFDDDVFDSPRIRTQISETCYNAKICTPEWFLSAAGKDTEEQLLLAKHKADYEYYRCDYANALESYTRCLGLVPKSNTAVQRDCIEGKARCCLKLGKTGEALQCAKELESLASNCDHRVALWMMLAEIHHLAANTWEEMAALCRCVLVRPWTSELWYRLSKCYLSQASSVANGISLPSSALMAGASLIRTRFLYQGSMSGHRSFGRVQNLKRQDEVQGLIEDLNLPPDFIELALEELNKEDDGNKDLERDDEEGSLALLAMTSAEVVSTLEKRWFSWVKHTPSSLRGMCQTELLQDFKLQTVHNS